MGKPFIFPNSDEWFKTIRMIADIGGDDKADQWAIENEALFEKYYKCLYCEHHIDGECHNLISCYAYEDIDDECICEDWEWDKYWE